MNDPLLEEAATGDPASVAAFLDRCQEKNALLEGVLALLAAQRARLDRERGVTSHPIPLPLPPSQPLSPTVPPVIPWVVPRRWTTTTRTHAPSPKLLELARQAVESQKAHQ